MKKCGGMTKAMKVDFFKKCLLLFILFMDVQHKRRFSRKVFFFLYKFCVYQQAKYFIDEKLVLKKEKSVVFYTKHIFITGHTSSQRLVSLNSLIKVFGLLKKDIVQ